MGEIHVVGVISLVTGLIGLIWGFVNADGDNPHEIRGLMLWGFICGFIPIWAIYGFILLVCWAAKI